MNQRKKFLSSISDEPLLFQNFCKDILNKVELTWWEKILIFLKLKKKPTRIDWKPAKGEKIIFRRINPFNVNLNNSSEKEEEK